MHDQRDDEQDDEDVEQELGDAGGRDIDAGEAKLLFYVFLVLFVVSLVMHLARGRGPSV